MNFQSSLAGFQTAQLAFGHGMSRTERAGQRLVLLVSLPLLMMWGALVALWVNGLDLNHPTSYLAGLSACTLPVLAYATNYAGRQSLVRYGLSAVETLHLYFVVGATLLLVMFLLQSGITVSRLSFVYMMAISACLTIGFRWALVARNRRRYGTEFEQTLVIEDSAFLDDGVYAGGQSLRLCGFDVHSARSNPATLDELGRMLRPVDRVVVSCETDKRYDWAQLLTAYDVRVDIIDRQATELRVLGAGQFGNWRTLKIAGYSMRPRDELLKRVFDIVVSALALVALAPVFLVTLAAIAIEDGRPFFFRQQRVGRDNCLFPMYKFRSMSAAKCDADASQLTQRNDARVTGVGRIIRATSIDELPQILNVFLGQMSIVGPRPHAVMARAGEKLYWEVDDRYWHRHRLKPGMTGLAQVRGHRGNTEEEGHLRDRLNADLEYIEGWSIWRDVRIVLATVKVLVHSRAF
ncbi:exopolysaccharide biosynthesis polyprenyl glycosylphosphotransferase [Qipengyuania sphaerica]|uniref:exopolysaccharide biosynthesis polyprenyl glycosylphosphotransferase n=1 Tax=Qipengyuania sphaerica TaxID=2867243 RepID=UPI001C872E40|nr:exopolysaccharide biosynthesis polyprenyl glycosylphosphotransferase [Qipengyuania sphaerica]MBX7540893.1 exopolysaccharide biosynthesis polyprenyl glycosylphosphotransferase [Qipengyuania sphaerica]